MGMTQEEVHKMAAEAVEWQKLGLKHLPLSAGTFLCLSYSTKLLISCHYLLAVLLLHFAIDLNNRTIKDCWSLRLSSVNVRILV